jgi:2-oxo-3-hexenedioate decarboxylase
MPSVAEIAERLIECQDRAEMLPSISAGDPSFDVARAYEVLAAIVARRKAQGWQPVGRKIGFTNRTIWSRYGVDRPMWAPTWSHSVHFAAEGRASLSLAGLVQPRIEPEVVFKLAAAPRPGSDATTLLDSIEWMAAGFEIVQSHFPDWKFTAADCTAAFGLHGALVVGTPLAVTAANRERLAETLQTFELTLSRDGREVERGNGSNVLGSPLNALAHLAHTLATQPQFAPLDAGEVITTGTLTDAWPVQPGETWKSDYGLLGVQGVTLRFA